MRHAFSAEKFLLSDCDLSVLPWLNAQQRTAPAKQEMKTKRPRSNGGQRRSAARIRPITAFITVTPAHNIKQQVAETMQMLRRAKIICLSRAATSANLRIATTAVSESTKGMRPGAGDDCLFKGI